MAKKTYVTLIDDIDDSEAAESITFALDGATYEIDLSEDNAAELRAAMEIYVNAARRTGGRKKVAPTANATVAAKPTLTVAGDRTPARRDKNQVKAVRQWAIENGYEVSTKGRVPEGIYEAFEEAHSVA